MQVEREVRFNRFFLTTLLNGLANYRIRDLREQLGFRPLGTESPIINLRRSMIYHPKALLWRDFLDVIKTTQDYFQSSDTESR